MKRWYCYNSETGTLTLETNTQLRVFGDGMLEADHGRHTKRPYQKHGHQSQPWHYRGYSTKDPGKKTTIFRSCGQNGPTLSAKHRVIMAEWKGRESK